MTSKVKLAFRFGDKFEFKEVRKVNLDALVKFFKEQVSQSENENPLNFEFIYCGRKLNDEDTLTASGIEDGVTIQVFRKIVKPTPKKDIEIPEAISSFGALNHTKVKAAAPKLASQSTLDKLLTDVPSLRLDPVGLSFIRSADLLVLLLDPKKAKKIFTLHPGVLEAAPIILSILNENVSAASTSVAPSHPRNLYSLDALLDDDEMDDSQDPDGDQAGDEEARALAERQRNSINPAFITPQMLGRALSGAFARAESAQRSGASSSQREASLQLQAMLAQMHELGLRDDVINMQALQACEMNVQEAINLIYSGAMFD